MKINRLINTLKQIISSMWRNSTRSLHELMSHLIHIGIWRGSCASQRRQAPLIKKMFLPEGQQKIEVQQDRSRSGPRGYKQGRIKPFTKIKTAFLLLKYFSWQWKLWKQRQREREKRAVINDAIIVDALVSVTVSGQQRPALSISSRVQKCTLTDTCKQKREGKRKDKYVRLAELRFYKLVLILHSVASQLLSLFIAPVFLCFLVFTGCYERLHLLFPTHTLDLQ